MAIELVMQRFEAPAQLLLVIWRRRAVALYLSSAEGIEGLLQLGSLHSDLFGGVVEVQLAGDSCLHFVIGRVSDKRVARADVEVDVGERFDAQVGLGSIWLHLRGKFEKEAKLADL